MNYVRYVMNKHINQLFYVKINTRYVSIVFRTIFQIHCLIHPVFVLFVDLQYNNVFNVKTKDFLCAKNNYVYLVILQTEDGKIKKKRNITWN